MSFDLILPFLRPIEHLILDPEISEIMVNGNRRVFIERDGRIEEIPSPGLQERSLQAAVKNIARILGDDISEERPMLDSRLPDGSRVAAIFPPCSIGGTTLSIRKFQARHFTAEQLVQIGALPSDLLSILKHAVESRQNILISGGAGTGKTTLLNALANYISDEERLVIIEDTAEIQVSKPNIVRLEARRGQPEMPAVTIRDLLHSTLRLRPDRILVGEVRGGEAFDLLQALNTGHSGSLSTIHANSASHALARFASLTLQSDIHLPYTAVRLNLAETVNLIVHLERRQGVRRVVEVDVVTGYGQAQDQFQTRRLYSTEKSGASL